MCILDDTYMVSDQKAVTAYLQSRQLMPFGSSQSASKISVT